MMEVECAEDSSECPICLFAFQRPLRSFMPCGHWICASCMETLLSSRHPCSDKCPLCRRGLYEFRSPPLSQLTRATLDNHHYAFDDFGQDGEYDDFAEEDGPSLADDLHQTYCEMMEAVVAIDDTRFDHIARNPLPALVPRRTLFANYGFIWRHETGPSSNASSFVCRSDDGDRIEIVPKIGHSWSNVYSQLGLDRDDGHSQGKTILISGLNEATDGFYIIDTVSDAHFTARRKMVPLAEASVRLDVFVMRGPSRGVHHWT